MRLLARKSIFTIRRDQAGRQFGILYLHSGGLETLVDKPAFTRVFDELGLACMCPHGQMCWWADRICREFDDRTHSRAASASQYLAGDEPALAAFRYAVSAFWASAWEDRERCGWHSSIQSFFQWSRAFPRRLDYHERYGKGLALDDMYDSKEQCRQDTALMHVPPADYPPHIFFCVDPDDVDWYRGNDRLHEKLSALGIPHTCDLTTRAGGHTWDYFNAMAERAVRFVHNGLEQESRRLL